jgi:Zn-dependent protease/predicted transcriptional regulator
VNRATIRVGRILGIPVGLDPSWFLIFILVTWTLAASYFPAEFKNWPAVQYWLVGAVTAVLFFGSIVLHELGHSVVALRFKIPVRSITLYIFGGIAAIGAEPPSARAEFFIAVSGPLVSLALAAFFALLQIIFKPVAPLLAASKYLAYINGTVALFNLIPGFPLDGGRVFRAILWAFTKSLRRATLIAANVGRAIAYGFILVGVWQVLSGGLGNGLWLAFIGWFLNNAASAELQQQTLQDMLAGHKVYEVMNRSYSTVDAATTLQSLVDDYILGSGRRCFMVTRGDREIGLLTIHHINQVRRDDWAAVTVAEAMTPMDQVKRVGPGIELWTALEQMDRDGVSQLPVMAEDRCLGMLGRDDIVSFLRARRELGL